MVLPSRLRLRGQKAIRTILRYGARSRTPLGDVASVPSPQDSGRVLFIISTRVAKKSTERHRLKRQLDEWARTYLDRRLARDVVMRISPAVVHLPRKELLRRAVQSFQPFAK